MRSSRRTRGAARSACGPTRATARSSSSTQPTPSTTRRASSSPKSTASTMRAANGAMSPSSTGPTPSPGPSKSSSSARASRTGSSAARASTSARRSRTPWPTSRPCPTRMTRWRCAASSTCPGAASGRRPSRPWSRTPTGTGSPSEKPSRTCGRRRAVPSARARASNGLTGSRSAHPIRAARPGTRAGLRLRSKGRPRTPRPLPKGPFRSRPRMIDPRLSPKRVDGPRWPCPGRRGRRRADPVGPAGTG